MSMRTWPIIWAVVFIAIGVIGGFIIGGLVQGHTAFIVAGLAFAAIGVLGLITEASAKPQAGKSAKEAFFVVMDFQNLAWWGWLILIVLLLVAIVSFFIWPVA
jgi:hypothetical protein